MPALDIPKWKARSGGVDGEGGFFCAAADLARGIVGQRSSRLLKKSVAEKEMQSGVANMAQASLLMTQKCTTLKQKQLIRRMTTSLGNKAAKTKTAKQHMKQVGHSESSQHCTSMK